MVSKFIIAAYMSILGTDNVHIWTNKIECIEVNDQIDQYLKQIDRMNQKVVGI